MSTNDVRGSADTLSVGALLYQSAYLIERLVSFTDKAYPRSAVSIARMLHLLATRTRSELRELDKIASGLSAIDVTRAQDLGRIVQVLYSYLRYLEASGPSRTPPGIQQAIDLLIAAHCCPVLGGPAADIDIVVRPQWTYNLKYIDLLHQFELDADCDLAWALDPRDELKEAEVRPLIEALAREADKVDRTDTKAPAGWTVPKHVAVLSFAGLDGNDVLLYPLLAHELGHFIDFALDDLKQASTASTTAAYLPSERMLKDAGLTSQDRELLVEKIRVCLRELTADLLAARMAGLGYYFAFNEFFKTFTDWPGSFLSMRSGYPGFGFRLKLIWEELTSPEGGIEAIVALRRTIDKWPPSGKARLRQYLDDSAGRLDNVKIPDRVRPVRGSETAKVRLLAENAVIRSLPNLQRLVRQLIPQTSAAVMPQDITAMVGLIRDRVPPFQPPTRKLRAGRGYRPWGFHEVLAAGWLYQIAIGEAVEVKLGPEKAHREYQDTCLLLLKALELDGAREAIDELMTRDGKTGAIAKPGANTSTGRPAGVVSGPQLRRAMDRRSGERRLVVCPDYGDGPIESASRDVHLGHWFRVSKRTSQSPIDLSRSKERQEARQDGQSEEFVPKGGRLILQSGDFALAASLEYVCVPSDMMAFVEGKSSLGRTGLIIATATQVAPGFKGCIVLELFNAGTVPIILRPAMRIAQLVFVSTDAPIQRNWLYSGDFQVQIRP